MVRRFARGVFLATLLVALSSAAQADMGRAPVPQGTTVSFEGGFLLLDGNSLTAYGTNVVAGTTQDVTINPRDGWFAGGLIGFSSAEPFFSPLPFKRLELYGLYGRTDAGTSDTAPPLAGLSLKNDDASALVTGGLTGRTHAERTIAEGQIRLEGDDILSPTRSITWVLAPFVRWSNEDVETVVAACCDLVRTSSVETRMYGVIVAAEPEFWLTDTVAFVGRLGAGIYGFDTDGDYRSRSTLGTPDPFVAALHDSDSGVGFRGQLGAGLKFRLWNGANLETFAEADYFSDTGSARAANNQPGDTTVSHTENSDLWEFRAGARVTIGIGQ